MNLKIKAALYAILFMAGSFSVGLMLSQLPNWAVLAFGLIVGLAALYSLIHAGLKFDAAVEEISKKYEK